MTVQAHAATADVAAAPPAVRVKSGALVLCLLALTILSASTMRSVFSPMQEVAKNAMHLSDFQVSLVQGLAASIPIAVLAIPLGWLVDRANRMRQLILMAAIWSAGTIWTAYAQDFNGLFLARMLAGLGAVCSLPVAISLAADLSAPEKRGRALLLLSVGVTAGMAVAVAGAGALFGALSKGDLPGLAGLEPWRAVHLVFGLASAALIVPLMFVREPARHEVSAPAPLFLPALKAFWVRRNFIVPLFFGQVGVVMADIAAGSWAAPILTRVFHQQPQDFGGWLGGMLLGVGLLGAVLGGVAADLGQKMRYRGGVLVGAVIFSALSIPAALFPIMPSVAGFGWLLAAVLLTGAAAGLIVSTAIATLVPNEERGITLGVFMVVGSVIGIGLAPVLVAVGSKMLGGEAYLAQALAIVGVAASIASFLGFLVAMLNAPKRADVA